MNIEIIDLNKGSHCPQLDTILLVDLKSKFIKYEQKLFQQLLRKNFSMCERYLTNFCFELFDLNEQEQVYVARIFFSSLVTGIMKKQALKNKLHPKTLAHTFHVIDTIESLENISAYLLYIPNFTEYIKQNIIGNISYVDSNSHIEFILELINNHLKNESLSVGWICKQINLSAAHINNLFKEHMDQTIGDYIAERRINEIAFEIITTSKPIKHIYKKYGFVNQSHFIQRFKRAKGMTPLQYRKRFFNN